VNNTQYTNMLCYVMVCIVKLFSYAWSSLVAVVMWLMSFTSC